MKKMILALALVSSASAFALEERYVTFEPTGGADMVFIDSKPVIPTTETVADQVRSLIKKSKLQKMICVAKYFDSASSSGHIALYTIRDCKI